MAFPPLAARSPADLGPVERRRLESAHAHLRETVAGYELAEAELWKLPDGRAG